MRGRQRQENVEVPPHLRDRETRTPAVSSTSTPRSRAATPPVPAVVDPGGEVTAEEQPAEQPTDTTLQLRNVTDLTQLGMAALEGKPPQKVVPPGITKAELVQQAALGQELHTDLLMGLQEAFPWVQQ